MELFITRKSNIGIDFFELQSGSYMMIPGNAVEAAGINFIESLTFVDWDEDGNLVSWSSDFI